MAVHEFSTLAEANQFFLKFKEDSQSGWRVCSTRKRIGASDSIREIKTRRMKIMFSMQKSKGIPIKYDGIPFVFIGSKDWNCHRGKDLDKRKKERKKAERIQREIETNKILHRNRCQISKKVDCPAMAYLLHIVKFPAYKLSRNRQRGKTKISKLLRDDLVNGKPVYPQDKFFLKLPETSEHCGHHTYELSEEARNRLFPKIPDEPDESDEMEAPTMVQRNHLSRFVKTEPFEMDTSVPGNLIIEIMADPLSCKQVVSSCKETADANFYRDKCIASWKAMLGLVDEMRDADTLKELYHNLKVLHLDLIASYEMEKKKQLLNGTR